MKNTALLTALAAALILAGCDGTSSPAGAGAGTSESTTGAVSEALAREKALTIARQNGTAMEVQLAGLIVEAVQELRPRWRGQFDEGLDNMACALGLDINRRQEAIDALTPDVGVIIPGMGLDVINQGTQAENNAACLAFIWADVVRPMNAWPRPNARAFSQEANQELANWGAQQLAMAVATSQTLAPIANTLSKMPGASVDQLKAKARELVLARANELRQQLMDTAKAEGVRGSEVSLNMTGQGPAPIHFTLADMDYQRGPGGSLVSRHGTTRFGSGYLEGVRYTVEAVTTSGQSVTRSSSTTTTSEASNTATTNAEARTQ